MLCDCVTRERERDVYYGVGRRPEKIVKKGEKLREAKATTVLRERVRDVYYKLGEGRKR